MKIWGGILMAIGILIAGASGICSLSVLFDSEFGGDLSILPLVLLFGGIPFAAGVGLIFAGRRLLRNASGNPAETVDPE